MSAHRTQQNLLTSYFPLQSRPRRWPHTLLSIPANVRARICTFALNQTQLYSETFIVPDFTAEYEIATALMLTCRMLHNDVFCQFYGRNPFVLHLRTRRDIRVLREMKAEKLASLREMTVHLTMPTVTTPRLCHYAGWGDGNCGRSCIDVPIVQRDMLASWVKTLHTVGPHLRPSGLRINLICELGGLPLDVARRISRHLLAPLYSRVALESCAVQLSAAPDIDLRQLAQDVAMRALGQPMPVQQRLGFLDLPPEIRLQILQYTDLVVPWREVEWRPGQGYWAPEGRECEGYPADYTENAFCRRVHSAFGARCDCWIAPLPLFLVCSVLRDEAEEVFFKKNRIVVKPAVGINRLAYCTPPILDAAHYLRNVIPARALRHLRVLEIVFSPLKGAYLEENEPAYADWLHTLDFIKDKLSYAKLVLRVAFSAYTTMHASYGPQFDLEPGEETTTAIYNSYKRVLYPLVVLKNQGLAHLQIDLTSPSWLFVGYGGRTKDELIRQRLLSTRAEIEMHVMGEGHADSLIELGDSLWKLVWNNKVFRDGCKYVDIYHDQTMNLAHL